ncbi:MAG: hydantoinase/oxoprolinase family protein [Chloroflexi bacterium]|nr:hydantoinase/oxoprolinase family protein [Chloroflexota bacterium]
MGIDIGGTFTDLVLTGPAGEVVVEKTPSTPHDYGQGIVVGLRALLGRAGLAGQDLGELVHGTTVATNAVLERKGARTGLLTTRGFRDILELRRLRMPRLYDLTREKPPPLVPRRGRHGGLPLRFEVDERLDHLGQVVRPLDEASVVRAIAGLVDQGVTSIAVCLLHSYANPAHEQRVGELIWERAPGVHVSLSSDVLPEIREYERTSTTAINAAIAPVVRGYLDSLASGLRELDVRAPLLLMQSNGGIMTARAATALPIHLIESGPAAGVVAALALGRQTGRRNLITLDMGGTTAKASIVEDGAALQVPEYEVGGGISVGSRLNRGGGYALRVPAIDIAEVGAGGGSLCRVTRGPALRVGPESAGAAPGPVCYGAGGAVATLTDANVVLGYLNPEYLVGGALRVDAAAARRALHAQVAEPLGLDLLAAAHGVHLLASASMTRAIRAVTIERGRDPRGFTLVAFGGNGPVHAVAAAEELGIREVLVPPSPGLFSAFGLLVAETEHHYVRTYKRRVDALDATELAARLAALRDEALADLTGEGYSPERVALLWYADLRYVGQSSELRLPLNVYQEVLEGPGDTPNPARTGCALPGPSRDDRELSPTCLAADGLPMLGPELVEAFGREHERTYGHRAKSDPVELVNLLAPDPRSPTPDTRSVYFGPTHGLRRTTVVRRDALDAEVRAGPLIVEEYDATTVVPPGWGARLAERGNIVLTRL